jgi:hypothetical protein
MSMILKSRLLYREMLLRIGSHLKPGYSEKQWIEKGFYVSYESLSKLQEAVKNHAFADEQERVWFFKTQQPRFAAWVEYFTLLYASQLFLPGEAGAAIDFWIAELKRTQHFLIKHAAFYEHQQEGTVYDENIFPSEGSYNRLAAQVIGREKYLDYVQQSLIQLLASQR